MLGAQWGDEGKGKLVDILAQQYDLIFRATGGANAGHTIYVGDKKVVFHLIPSGMLHAGKVCAIGNGTVIHFPTLLEEIDVLKQSGVDIKGRLFISQRAHIVFEYHKIIDKAQEEMKGNAKIGTTGRGIGPAYADKISRIGIRVGELLDFENFSRHYRQNLELLKKMYKFEHDGDAELNEFKKIIPVIAPFITDTSLMFENAVNSGKYVLFEGANGTLLDIDHGTYPFVTSSNATISGIIAGCAVAPSRLTSIIGIMKAYLTRVGSGPFPTELKDKLGDEIREAGNEFGSTTGRPRRCGWFDAVGARYAVRLNGLTAINLTKIDVLNDLLVIKIGIAYKHKGKRLTEFPFDADVLAACEVEYIEMPGWQKDTSAVRDFNDLPENCKAYILKLEELIKCPIMFIGVGRSREQMILR